MRAMIEEMRAIHDLSKVPDFKNRDPEASAKIVANNPPVGFCKCMVGAPERNKTSFLK